MPRLDLTNEEADILLTFYGVGTAAVLSPTRIAESIAVAREQYSRNALAWCTITLKLADLLNSLPPLPYSDAQEREAHDRQSYESSLTSAAEPFSPQPRAVQPQPSDPAQPSQS